MNNRTALTPLIDRLVGISYVDQPEKKTTFQYDGLNRRAVMVETHGNASTTSTFLWDGTDLLRAQTGNLMKWYYPQGEIHGTESLFYVSDRLGSVRETVNQNHLITARMRYTAYGETQTAGYLAAKTGRIAVPIGTTN